MFVVRRVCSGLWLHSVLRAAAVKQFNSNNLSRNDASVIQLCSATVKMHMKETLHLAVVVASQQAAQPGWGRWAFVSLVVEFPAAPSINKNKKALLIIPFFSVACFCPWFVGVMCLFAATPLLVSSACCGHSAGTFYSPATFPRPAAVEPQNKRV